MLFPFKIIDSTISERTQFDMTDGYQPSHSLFYLKKGSFVIELNGIRVAIGEGECLLLPDYLHFKRSVLNPIEFLYIKFTDNTGCPYSFDISYGKVSPKDKGRFESSIAALESCVADSGLLAAAYREHLLLDILFQLFYEQRPAEAMKERHVSNDKLIAAAEKYVLSNIGRRILIGDLCRVIGTNPSTLNFRMRRELGMSTGEYIINARVETAKRLLLSTTYSISQIAERCGFENVYYFSNLFKRYTGIQPSKYRHGAGALEATHDQPLPWGEKT